MLSFVIPTWLAIFIAITAAIWLVSALRNIFEFAVFAHTTKKCIRELSAIKEASTNPDMQKSCTYAIYQIGKVFESKRTKD